MILPPNMNTKVKKFEVINSVIKAGKLDKHSFKSLSSGLIPLIYHDYGPTACRNFLDNTQRLICRWLMLNGFSVGLSDLMMEEEHKINVKEVIKKNKDEAIKLLDDFRSGQLRNDTIYDNEMDTLRVRCQVPPGEGGSVPIRLRWGDYFSPTYPIAYRQPSIDEVTLSIHSLFDQGRTFQMQIFLT